uniref:Uncharacterized protein n=1 Tax=Micrurus spixii TaxID=129469 RepID=A0A2D4MUX6_9SAUR
MLASELACVLIKILVYNQGKLSSLPNLESSLDDLGPISLTLNSLQARKRRKEYYECFNFCRKGRRSVKETCSTPNLFFLVGWLIYSIFFLHEYKNCVCSTFF